MRTLAYLVTASACVIALGTAAARAQSTEQKIEGYTPPPLFGSPPIAQPRPSGDGGIITPGRVSPPAPAPLPPGNEPYPTTNHTPPENLAPAFVKPRVSRSNEDQPLDVEPYIPKFPPMEPVPMEQTPAGRGEIVERPRKPIAPPLPTHKPPVPKKEIAVQEQPASAPTPAPKTAAPAPVSPPAAPPTVAAKPQTPPPVPVESEPETPTASPTAQPAQKVTSKGVVTGPKTMPSVPTSGVEKMETFVADETVDKTLLELHAERQQQAADEQTPRESEAAQSLPPLPADFSPVARIEAVDAANSRMTLDFAPGQADLTEEQRLTILHNIVPILSGDAGQRLMIQSYASPVDDGQSSDRRVALSRALAVRGALITQGIEARRIDVRALGNANGQGAADRADLILSAQ